MSKQYLKNFNKGVITALVTPLTKDLNIKCEVIKDLIEFQIKNLRMILKGSSYWVLMVKG